MAITTFARASLVHPPPAGSSSSSRTSSFSSRIQATTSSSRTIAVRAALRNSRPRPWIQTTPAAPRPKPAAAQVCTAPLPRLMINRKFRPDIAGSSARPQALLHSAPILAAPRAYQPLSSTLTILSRNRKPGQPDIAGCSARPQASLIPAPTLAASRASHTPSPPLTRLSRNRKPGQPDIAGSTTRSQVPLKSAFKKRPFLTKGKVPRPRKSVQWHELSELFIVSRWIEPEPEDEAIPEEDEPEDNQDQGQEQVDDPDQLALLAELEELWF